MKAGLLGRSLPGGPAMGGWGYGPLGSQEYRASGLGSLCRTGRSQGVSAPVRSGEESTRDGEAGEEQHQLPPLRCLRGGVKCLPLLWCKASSGDGAGPQAPWARLCRDTGGGCGGGVTLTAARGHGAPGRAWWATPGSPKGAGHPPCSALCAWRWGGDRPTQEWTLPSLQGEEQPLRTPLFASARPVRLPAAPGSRRKES